MIIRLVRMKEKINSDYLIQSILENLKYFRNKQINTADKNDILYCLSYSVMKIIQDKLFHVEELYKKIDVKKVYYLSIEYLIGDLLENNLINLGIDRSADEALSKIGFDIREVIAVEREAALGTGGLGRLAACFLDSISTLGLPGYGYGINYEFGSLKQEILNGYQVERPDNWCRDNSPWLIARHGQGIKIPIYGHIDKNNHDNQTQEMIWKNCDYILGIPHDIPIVGYGGKTVNYLRLFSAKSPDELNFEKFYYGEYTDAVGQKDFCERISKIIYPSDSTEEGKELRLLQEYFLVATAIRDIVRNFELYNKPFSEFSSKIAIQINDTHPSLAIVEFMRILTEEKGINWNKAWDITNNTFGYTNHTLLPEALEKWPVDLIERVIPLHLHIIYKINKQFLKKLKLNYNVDSDRLRKMSVIEESATKYVRMTNLSIIGSHSVNGVSELHTDLLKKILAPDFFQLWPEKFNNKTNGITQRRWLLKANPDLSKLITDKLGNSWITNLFKLKELQNHIDDQNFKNSFYKVKKDNKNRLMKFVVDATGVSLNPDALFDVQIKRIHEYKRQLLNLMHIVHTYFSIIEDRIDIEVPRNFIFAGKSAPGYHTAKMIIKLINNIAKVINSDKRVNDQLKVVFIPNYNVNVAEMIIPATDLSEQISTAGKEASGTSNMKFSLNGAVIIGTLDGANVEIKEEVGDENIFIFGKTSDQIAKMNYDQSYDPRKYYNANDNIKRVMDSFKTNVFCADEPEIFKFLFDSIVNNGDAYFHLADFESYVDTQKKINTEFLDRDKWTRKMIMNTCRIGKFSSDRTIKQYANEIWGVKNIKTEDN